MMGEAPPWWQSAVVYQIYPRSFADSNGDGIGDLDGIRRHLDHLVGLGVDALWLSPVFPSPMEDFGYDVSDYCGVDPVFGTLADLDGLVAEAHARGLRVLLDWVPNHTSSAHPWFVESRSSRRSPKRDWYVWRDDPSGPDASAPIRPPNNWLAAFGQPPPPAEPGQLRRPPAWTWDDATRQWYLHMFLPSQPDLNWANPEVEAAMANTLRFWLDRGVDGFRIDVVHGLGKDPELPDAPEEQTEIPWSGQNDHPSTHAILRRLRALVDAYPGDRVLVGEVFLLSTARVATYYGSADELHLAFNFPPLFAPWAAGAWRRRIQRVVEELDPRGAWPTWVLSNHDTSRHRTRYGSQARARAAAVLLLTLRGTPFLYAGEELGLQDAVIAPGQAVDPGGRDGCRAPIPWDGSPGHGWPPAPDGGGPPPWLPFPPRADTDNVADLAADPGSILHLYRRLLAARRNSPALALGSWDPLPSPEGVLAYARRAGPDRRVVLVNYTPAATEIGVRPLGAGEGAWRVEVASDGEEEGAPFRGRLGPDQAVVLTPAS